jgi:hypothetical protein
VTTLQRIRSADDRARKEILSVLREANDKTISPQAVFSRVRIRLPEVPDDSFHRATWTLLSEGLAVLTAENNLRLLE